MQDILKILLADHLLSTGFRDHLMISVGDGKRVNFWHDPWVSDVSLCNLYPRLFSICENKTAKISEVGTFMNGNWQWSLSFRRRLFSWEEEIYAQFRSNINGIIPAVGMEDKLVWCLNQNGLFTVKDICLWVEGQIFHQDNCHAPKSVSKFLPPKVSLFVWQAMKNKIATRDNLIARGIDLNGAIHCPLCTECSESCSHLFLHCHPIWNLWCEILAREGLCWVIPSSLNDLFLEWDCLHNTSDKILWNLIPYALLWSIWLERNNICFNQKQFNSLEVWDAHLLRIGWWAHDLLQQNAYTIDQLSRNFTHIKFAPKLQKPRVAFWSPPDAGIIKANVDGSAKGSPGRCGIGGILRNSENMILGFFSKNIGEGFAFEAEVWAIHEMLHFCVVRQLKFLIIESDSSLAVGWVNNRSNRPWKLINVLNQIDQWMKDVRCLKVIHIFREANSEADRLAHRGADFFKDLVYFKDSI